MAKYYGSISLIGLILVGMQNRTRKSDGRVVLWGIGLHLKQSQSGCLTPVAYNPIALEFKEGGSQLALKSQLKTKQPTIWAL